ACTPAANQLSAGLGAAPVRFCRLCADLPRLRYGDDLHVSMGRGVRRHRHQCFPRYAGLYRAALGRHRIRLGHGRAPMGMIATAAAVVAALVVGALLAWAVERELVRSGEEAGPARIAQLRHGLDVLTADRWLLLAAPVVALGGVALGMVVVPFGGGLIGRDLGIGVFYFIVVIDFVVLGVALGGWGANTTDAVDACYRIVAQLVAYVVPLGLA